jgi:hypothetical protein
MPLQAGFRTARAFGQDDLMTKLTGQQIAGGALDEWAYLLGGLQRARLSAADLTGANLRGALLDGACLRGSTLERADFTKTRLKATDLSGAVVTSAVGLPDPIPQPLPTVKPEPPSRQLGWRDRARGRFAGVGVAGYAIRRMFPCLRRAMTSPACTGARASNARYPQAA